MKFLKFITAKRFDYIDIATLGVMTLFAASGSLLGWAFAIVAGITADAILISIVRLKEEKQ